MGWRLFLTDATGQARWRQTMAENLLLAALPEEERRRLDPFLEPVNLHVLDVLIEANQPITHVFFPYDCVTSTIQAMSDGSTIEVGLMGIEGFIGVQLWLRSRETPTHTLVQVAGRAHRMHADTFQREVMRTPSPLNDLIARYTHAFLTMTSQTAACNRLHTIDERLCRWLKMIHNRTRRDTFAMRQEFMAQMLGVHRPSVSVAANILQKAGLIRYSRGQMEILDPEGLREGACECYQLMEAQFNRIFEQPWRDLAREEDQR
jgi:CRP-like cAMP-binding protein